MPVAFYFYWEDFSFAVRFVAVCFFSLEDSLFFAPAALLELVACSFFAVDDPLFCTERPWIADAREPVFVEESAFGWVGFDPFAASAAWVFDPLAAGVAALVPRR